MEAHTSIIIFTFALFDFSNIVDAKFCAFELNGERRYYTCPRNEYCCNFGCCVSPAFQFYQLWYYWLLVIFMFLLCSGGGWWYRYWLQSRYRTCPGSILPVANSNVRNNRIATRSVNTQQRRPSRPRVARVSYNPARDTVMLHRIWKGQRNYPPPSYSSAQAESSSNQPNPYHSSMSHPPMITPATSLFPHGHIPSGVNGQECPYFQLYGPPPSYDSVMSELGENSISVALPSRQIPAESTSVSPNTQATPSAANAIPESVNNLHNLLPASTSSTDIGENVRTERLSDDNNTQTVHEELNTNAQGQNLNTFEQSPKRENINPSCT